MKIYDEWCDINPEINNNVMPYVDGTIGGFYVSEAMAVANECERVDMITAWRSCDYYRTDSEWLPW